MANIELVVKIPEEEYEEIINSEDCGLHELTRAIANGTPLPKGHGDLIDRNDLLADSYSINDWSGNEVNIVDIMTVEMADAIIEADKEQ